MRIGRMHLLRVREVELFGECGMSWVWIEEVGKGGEIWIWTLFERQCWRVRDHLARCYRWKWKVGIYQVERGCRVRYLLEGYLGFW
jgi:hypothetical protein